MYGCVCPAKQRFYPQDQLGKQKRLYNIIVCAQIKAAHFILGLTSCSQKNDGSVRSFTQGLVEHKAVPVGQVDIQ